MKDSRVPKTLLVTGGAGFIGSAFVRKVALEEGVNVIVLDSLTYAGSKENLSGVPCLFIHGDINDRSLVYKILEDYQPDALLNFAAETHVDRSIINPNAFIETNVMGTASLLDCSLLYWKETSKKDFIFLQVSTDEVFGSLTEVGYFNEQSLISPNSPYAASKASADHLVLSWHHTFDLPVIITRCTNNYGPRQYPEKLIPLTIKNALNGLPISVYGNGRNIRDWIHVDDHCDGIWLALTKGKVGKSYGFGGQSECRNIDLVQKICWYLDDLFPRASGQSYEELITFVQDRLGHDFRYAMDISYAKRELGFSPKHLFEDSLRDVVGWYASQWIPQLISAPLAEVSIHEQTF